MIGSFPQISLISLTDFNIITLFYVYHMWYYELSLSVDK